MSPPAAERSERRALPPASLSLPGEPLLLAAILALAAFVRLWRLDDYSFWLDEYATLRYALDGPFGLWVKDTHPPLYYALVSLWRYLGDSVFVLRLSSALPSLATVWLVYRCALIVGGRPTAAIAGLLQALAPFALAYAQELRMYALLEFSVCLALFGLLQLVREPAAAAAVPWRGGKADAAPSHRTLRRAWWLYALGTLVTLFAHNLGFLWPLAANLAAFALWAWAPADRRLLRRWVVVNLCVLALWTPWWPAMIEQARMVAEEFWLKQPSVSGALAALARISHGFRAPLEAWELGLSSLLVMTTLLGLLAMRPPALALVLLSVAVVPPVVAFALGYMVRPLFLDRTLIWTGIPFALATACALAWLLRWRNSRWRLWRLGAGGAVLLAVLGLRGTLVAQYYDLQGKADWRGLFAELAWALQPADRVAVLPGIENQSYGVEGLRQPLQGRPVPPPGKSIYSKGALAKFASETAEGERFWVIHSQEFGPVLPDLTAVVAAAAPCLQAERRLEAALLEATLFVATFPCRRSP